MSNSTKIVSNLTPVLVAMTASLATLKLTGVLTWPWWVVTAPIWGPIAFSIVVWFLILSIMGLVFMMTLVCLK